MTSSRRESKVMCTLPQVVVLWTSDCGGRSWWRTWLRSLVMAANIFSSASWHKSANVWRFAGTRSLRRMNAARRWRSDAPAKPHQALEACINLATTTERKIVCSETSSMPWARKTLYKVCALKLITTWTCSATERLFVKVTPRIFKVVTRAMPVMVAGEPFSSLSTKTISANLSGFCLEIVVPGPTERRFGARPADCCR